MSWDDHAVRIELHAAMRLGRTVDDDGKTTMGMVAGEVALVWLMNADGKTTTRKPAIKFGGAGQTRAEILQDIASWMEVKEDPGLTQMVAEMQKLET